MKLVLWFSRDRNIIIIITALPHRGTRGDSISCCTIRRPLSLLHLASSPVTKGLFWSNLSSSLTASPLRSRVIFLGPRVQLSSRPVDLIMSRSLASTATPRKGQGRFSAAAPLQHRVRKINRSFVLPRGGPFPMQIKPQPRERARDSYADVSASAFKFQTTVSNVFLFSLFNGLWNCTVI